jgi:hypothetical protein
MVEFNSTPIIGGAYNEVPYNLNGLGTWIPMDVMTGSPCVNKLKVIGNELYSVGRQMLALNGSFPAHTMVVKWTGGPLSLNQLSSKQFKIYPNPSNGVFIVEQPFPQPGDLVVYDLIGNKIFEKKIESGNEKIDLSSFDSGVYTVIMKQEAGTCTKRIIVQ